ncbi:hypothetical protein DMC30DRAFT_416968 [Rhodotorula diobovata]|uniref:COX assembly mitochondrial protein n=1 Tax=Rhodotorula diobovata TaxID=5288 RepID=A0A5C5FXC6_9BASI|nr:hypothetical protein DMC30DRAFT_416968 [Rhodotorula diobovata]
MHPPLAEHQQTACIEVMNQLKACHDSYPWLKFVGMCNSEKGALNACLRKERLERTSKNAQLAKDKRKEIERRWKEIEQES